MVYDEFQRKKNYSSEEQEAGDQTSSSNVEHDPVTLDQPSKGGVFDDNESSLEEDPLEWARKAYATLKTEQQAQKEEETAQKKQELESKTLISKDARKNTLDINLPLDQLNNGSKLLEKDPSIFSQIDKDQILIEESKFDQPSDKNPLLDVAPEKTLGDFDATFTWSAEVLSAQGYKPNEVSIEEINWLGRLRKGLEKTRQGFVTGLLENLGDDPLTPELLDDLETLLLRSDAGVKATDQVLDALRQRMNEVVVEPDEGIRFLKQQLCDLINVPIQESGSKLLSPEKGKLNIWMLVGVNGVGKTTTLGKLANLAVRSGYSALIAAADTFRAAAVDQVKIWGERSDVQVVSNSSLNADPAAVVFDAIGAAQAKEIELLLVDTAGRLQTKHNLMEELKKVRRIIDKLAPEANVQSLLVLDASQGQNGLRQAMAFAKAASLTGVIITKLDGTARGGVALAVSSEVNLPIRFIGAGEGIRDLRPFNSFEFVEALLANR